MIFKRYKHKSKLVANIDVFQPTQIIICIVAISVVLLAGCGNSKKEESLAVSGNGNAVQEVSEKKDVSENSSGEGMDVLFAGTALEEIRRRAGNDDLV